MEKAARQATDSMDEHSTSKVIENANGAVKSALCLVIWMVIHQGNDCY